MSYSPNIESAIAKKTKQTVPKTQGELIKVPNKAPVLAATNPSKA